MNKYKTIPEVREAQRKAGLATAEKRRSPELRRARADKNIIRKRFDAGESNRSIAEDYGINARATQRILKLTKNA